MVPGLRLQRRGRAGASRSVDRFLWIGIAFYRSFRAAFARLPWLGILLTALALPALRNVAGDLPANLLNIAMGITFGLCHLIYAVWAWPRRRADEIEQFAVE